MSNLSTLFDRYKALVVFDTETSGLDFDNDQIIELAALRVERTATGGLRIAGKMDTFIKLPEGETLPENIVSLTGITDERLQTEGVQPVKAAGQIAKLMQNGPTLMIAHNAQFDACFLRGLLRGQKVGRIDWLDSLTVYKDRRAYPHKLANAIIAYDLTGKVQNSHRAIDDVLALFEVLKAMDDEREDDHGLSDLLGSFSLSDQKKKSAAKPAAPKAEAKPEISQEKPKAEAVPEKKPEALKPLRERKPRPPRPAREEGEKRDFAPMIPAETFAPTEPPVIHPEDTPAGRAQKFLMDVTDRMGVKVDVYVDDSKADNLSIHMIGDTLGILIGRRGETLDALQYLTSLQVNKGREGYIRVTLDTENYRAKREDSLRRLAQRMANRAVKTGRRVVLEPMNPYERRVLHTALQNHPAVTTHSEGEEPNRRVVILLKNQPERPEKSAEKPQSDRPNNRRRSNRRRGPRKPVNQAENQPVNETQDIVAAPESPAVVDVLGVEE